MEKSHLILWNSGMSRENRFWNIVQMIPSRKANLLLPITVQMLSKCYRIVVKYFLIIRITGIFNIAINIFDLRFCQ